jgi:AcrR family transcriptional regulator/DNA-binding Xre family transcriptional regulator
VSLRELARRIGVSPATLSAVERGRTGLSLGRLVVVADALGVSAEELVRTAVSRSPRREARGAGWQGPGVSSPRGASGGAASCSWKEFAPLPIDPVLAAAVRAFVASGYHGASMRAIAAHAGMSVSGLYHHYPSKHDMLVRILEVTMADLAWRLEAARDEGEGALAQLGLVVEALALFHMRRRDLAFIGASEMRSLEPPAYRHIAGLRRAVQRLVDDRIEAVLVAEGRESSLESRVLGKAVATMCTALAQWYRDGGPASAEEIAELYGAWAVAMVLGHARGAGEPLRSGREGASPVPPAPRS